MANDTAAAESANLAFTFSRKLNPKNNISPVKSKLSIGNTDHPFHHDDESEDEGHHKSSVTVMENGVVHDGAPKVVKNAQIIIPPLPARDWRKRKPVYVPAQEGSTGPSVAVESLSVRDQKYGLQKFDKQVEVKVEDDIRSMDEISNSDSIQPTQKEVGKSDEELAREALIAQALDPSAAVSTKPQLVIPSMSEYDAYIQDMSVLPEAPDEAAYARVPVDQFGVGIMLGLGWKEGTSLGKNGGTVLQEFKEVKRRPEGLGVGAKEEEIMDLQANGKNKSRKDMFYFNPLRKIDKKTGELVSEGEGSLSRTSKSATPAATFHSRDTSRYQTPARGGGYDSRRDPDKMGKRTRESDREPTKHDQNFQRHGDRDRRRDDDRDNNWKRYRDDDRSQSQDTKRTRYDKRRHRSRDMDRERDRRNDDLAMRSRRSSRSRSKSPKWR